MPGPTRRSRPGPGSTRTGSVPWSRPTWPRPVARPARGPPTWPRPGCSPSPPAWPRWSASPAPPSSRPLIWPPWSRPGWAEPGQEAADRFPGAQDMDAGTSGVDGDRLAQSREAAAPVGPDPAPVFGLFAAAAQGAPGAAREAEVQHDHGVGRAQTQGQVAVVGAEVAVDDPFAALDQVGLAGGPPGGPGRCGPVRPGLPEQRVQFGHRQAGRAAKVMAQRRLARPTAPEDHHSSHPTMMGPGDRWPTAAQFIGKPLISPNVGRCMAAPDPAE